MGWVIKRPDGTYRCWNSNAQEDVLQAGEVWEQLTTPPAIATAPDPRPPKAQILAAIGSATTVADLKVALLQLLQRVT